MELRFRVVVILLLAGACNAPLFNAASLLAQDEARARRYNQDGIKALNAQDYQAAILNLELARDYSSSDEIIAKNLAVAYNNYAMKLIDKRDIEQAVRYLELAVKIAPFEESAKSNLTNLLLNEAHSFYAQAEPDKAVDYLEKSLDYAKDDAKAQALVLLGEIAYYRQELFAAKKYWEEAFSINPNILHLKEKFDKLNQEIDIENRFEETTDAFFDIRAEQDYTGFDPYDIKGYLRDAYREIGRDFGYYPRTKIIVIIYSEENFKKLRADTPEWLGGLYDGKIRLPIKKYFQSEKEFQKLLYHEYTHAVIYSLTKGSCPIWLNEGLAKYSEIKIEDNKLSRLRAALKNDSLIPLNELNQAFSFNSSADKAALAYEEAYSIVKYIIYRYNFWHIREILEKLAGGENFEDALDKSIYINFKRLEENWREFLESEYK